MRCSSSRAPASSAAARALPCCAHSERRPKTLAGLGSFRVNTIMSVSGAVSLLNVAPSHSKSLSKALDAAENAAAREEEQRIPETIRLADASGLTVRVTIEDERFTRVVTVSGCVLESDAVSAVSPYLNSNFLQRVETEVL